jgi:hypothetical protein
MRKLPPTTLPGKMMKLTPQLLQLVKDFPRDIEVLNAVAVHEHYSTKQKLELIKETLLGTIAKLN